MDHAAFFVAGLVVAAIGYAVYVTVSAAGGDSRAGTAGAAGFASQPREFGDSRHATGSPRDPPAGKRRIDRAADPPRGQDGPASSRRDAAEPDPEEADDDVYPASPYLHARGHEPDHVSFDERIVRNGSARTDPWRADEGRRNMKAHLDRYFREELEDAENTPWWGRHEY